LLWSRLSVLWQHSQMPQIESKWDVLYRGTIMRQRFALVMLPS
jgi:hypothetical protein